MNVFVITIILSVWLGFVLAISFMESWLKFRAGGVTLAVGLSIGNLVFKGLNIIEWLALGTVFAFFVSSPADFVSVSIWILGFLTLLLSLQTVIILPVLRRRAIRTIAGEKNRPSRVHLMYIVAEILKVVFLICLISAFGPDG